MSKDKPIPAEYLADSAR